MYKKKSEERKVCVVFWKNKQKFQKYIMETRYKIVNQKSIKNKRMNTFPLKKKNRQKGVSKINSSLSILT